MTQENRNTKTPDFKTDPKLKQTDVPQSRGEESSQPRTRKARIKT